MIAKELFDRYYKSRPRPRGNEIAGVSKEFDQLSEDDREAAVGYALAYQGEWLLSTLLRNTPWRGGDPVPQRVTVKDTRPSDVADATSKSSDLSWVSDTNAKFQHKQALLPSPPPGVPALDFEWVWTHYASENVSSKTAAKAAFDQAIRSPEDYRMLRSAIERYSNGNRDRSKMYALTNFIGRGIWRDFATAGAAQDRPRTRCVSPGRVGVLITIPEEDAARYWDNGTKAERKEYMIRTGWWDPCLEEFYPEAT